MSDRQKKNNNLMVDLVTFDDLDLGVIKLTSGDPMVRIRVHDQLAYNKIELARTEIHFRAWKANVTAQMLEASAKKPLSEWKIKAAIESDPEWSKFKDAYSRCQHTIDLLEGALDVIQNCSGGES